MNSDAQSCKKLLQQELLDVRRTLGWVDLVLSSIIEAVCVVDEQHNIVFVNTAFEELSHGHRIFLLGEPIVNIIDLQSADGTLASRLKQLKNGLVNVEKLNGIYTQQFQGTTQVFDLTVRYIPTLHQAVFMMHNITLQQESDRMKSEFIALASHQLRTPLSTIKVYSHMLQQGYAGKLDDEQADYLTTMIQAADHMYYIVNNLLNISRLETGQFTITHSKISLTKVLEEVVAIVEPKAVQKHIDLSFRHPHAVPAVMSDHMMLREVFSNIIMNAIQYTPERGEVSVALTIKVNELVVKITDSGIGIPIESQDQLFSPFYRAPNALELFPGGTGLGLYVVKLMLESLGGRIWFVSHEGRGTTFVVCLPLPPHDHGTIVS
jgi:signal transduction histidine kinase